MALLLDLIFTDYGLVALAVTLISLAVAWGFHAFIRKKMRESAPAGTSDEDKSSR